jgi:GT2 family glycosyltransferase
MSDNLKDVGQNGRRVTRPDATSMAPLVAISILNWNSWQDTLECLESVRRLDYLNYLIVVVDNGSWNNSAERIKAWAEENLGSEHAIANYTREIALMGGRPEDEQALGRTDSPARMVLIRNEENVGFTGGNNVAIHYALNRAAAADYVLLLNNDARIDAHCAARLVLVSQKAEAGIVGALVTDRNWVAYFAGSASFRYHLFRSLTSRPVRPRGEEFWGSPIAYGAAMLVSRQVLETIYRHRREYLKESLFAYGDEIEFCWVARRAGYRTVIANGAAVCHDSARRGQAPREHSYFFYYSTRNILYLAKDILPILSRVAFHIVYLPLCIRRIAKRIIAGQPKLARAIACGLLDGYRGVGGKWIRHDWREPNRSSGGKVEAGTPTVS